MPLFKTGLVDRPIAWRFLVEISGIEGSGEFTECSGLTVERTTDDHPEGGVNNFVHKLPGRISQSPVTLKRGILDLDLWNWFAKGMDLQMPFPELRTVTIKLANTAGELAVTWTLENAYPTKWTGPTFNTTSNELAMEELELTHHGLSMEANDGLTPVKVLNSPI